MRRFLTLPIYAAIVVLGAGCTQAPGQLTTYQSNWNPVTERHEALFAACSVQDGWHVKIATPTFTSVYVQVTLPGDVVEEGMTYGVFPDVYLFTSQGTVDAGECYSILLVDTLGAGPFTFTPILG